LPLEICEVREDNNMARILVVDDAAFMRVRAAKVLQDNGHEVAQAENGRFGSEGDPGVRRCDVIKVQFLHQFPIFAPDGYGQWLGFDGHAEPARAKLLYARHLASAQLLRGREGHKHGGSLRWVSTALFIEREQLDPQCPLADFAEDELRVLSGEMNGDGCRERPSRQR